MLQRIIQDLVSLSYETHVDFNDKLNWIKSIRPQSNEEYKEKISQIKTQIALCNGFNRENRDKIFVLLDSLKPQSHWKPSDEMLEALYRAVPQNVKEMSEDEILLDKLYQGLKYSKNAYNCIKEHWKPSEEQMLALKYEIRSTNENSWQRRECEKLYVELQKL